MRTPFALPMLVAVLVAVSSRVDADTLKFAWWRMDQIATAVGFNQSAIDERTQVLAAANVDVMAGVGLWSRADGVFPSSNGYRLENGRTVTNGSFDGLSRVFALSHAFDAVESANEFTPMVHGTKNVPGANATVAWTVFDAGSTRFAVLSGFIYQLYNAKYKNNLDALVENIATNGNPVIVFGLEDACETRTLTLSDFEDCGLYAVRDGTADGQWIFCSDQAMATAAASTVADLPGATAYGTVGYTAEFSYEGEDAGVGYQVVFKQGNVAPVGTRVRSRGGALAFAAPAASVEVAPEFVCNPNATRWNTPGSRPGFFAREVQDLHVYNGKIYTAGGDWGAFSNQGPVPVFAIDPATGNFTNEYEAGTELITDFKTFSDGRLWAGSVDMRESHEHAGHFFRRETDGTWTNLTSCISGHNGVTANYAAHIWDIAEFGGKFFTAGYGICSSSNWGDTRMTDATPDLSSGYRTYFESATSVWIAGKNRFNVGQARKFAAFMPFDDDLFCFSMDFGYKYYMDIFEWEEWRWDASLGKFVSSLVPWSDFAPGITEEDKAITVSPDMSDYLEFDIRPSHCRRFGSRVLYLIEGIKTNVASHSRPWAAYSAVNQNHHVKATKIDLGGARPFDIHVCGDAAYIVAAKGTEMGTVVTNSVWKTEDGVTFTELFHFATNRYATALCKYGDDFYVGMGYSTNVCYIWKNLPKTPELSGNIYRIRFDDGNQGGGQGGDVPQPPAPSDVAWFSYEAATGATSGGTWDGEASSFGLFEPLTIDHVGTVTMQLRVRSAAEFPMAEPAGIASFAFRRDGDAPVPWEWTSRGWQRLYGLSVAEGQAVSLVATVGNGKVSYSIDGVALTNSAGRSVFSTHGVGFSSLCFSFPSVGNFSGTLREERMKRFWMTLR